MKNSSVAICVDDNGGLLFNNRRQSRDRILISELCATSNLPIYVSPFSAELFPDKSVICECENPFLSAPDGATLFVEDVSIVGHLADVGQLIIYKWNRSYPRDTFLGFDPRSTGFTPKSITDFVGSSHEKITKEMYTK